MQVANVCPPARPSIIVRIQNSIPGGITSGSMFCHL